MKKRWFSLMFFAVFVISSITVSAQPWSIACPDDPAGGLGNPAYFGTLDGAMFQSFVTSIKNPVTDKIDNSFYNVFGNPVLPFGVDFHGNDHYSLWWGLSIGDDKGGIGYHDRYTFIDGQKKHIWSVGLLSRPSRWLAWGATYGEGYQKDIRTGIALRPGVEFFTLWGDCLFDGEFEYRNALVGAEIIPLDGVHFRGSYDIENEEIWFGMRFELGHSALTASSNAETDNLSAGIILSSQRFRSLMPYRAKSIKLTLKGSYPESPSMLNGKSFRRLSDALTLVVDDPKTEEIIIKLYNPGLPFAQLEDLRGILERFQARGGKVTFFAEHLGNGSMYLTSAADRVCLPPAGSVIFNGIGIELTYLKGLLNKIGVQADIVHIGKFKTGYEQFYADSMSEQMHSELMKVLAHLDTIIVNQVAKGKNIPVETVRKWIEDTPHHSNRAMESELIDTIAYWDEFEEFSGWDKAKKLTTYLDEHDEITVRWDDPPAIAVITVEGSIISGYSGGGGFISGRTAGAKTIAKLLEKAKNDGKVKGIILRIDSPGGSAYASDIIWHAVRDAAEEKPVWVSQAAYAASGGYYIASAGDSIFSNITTMTGSIGVIGGKFSIHGLYDKLGIRKESIYLSPNANLYSLTDTFSTTQRELVRRSMEDSYNLFKERILTGRENLTADSLEALAQGQIQMGITAKSNGLIDEIAGISEVEKRFAKHLKLGDDYEIKHYTPYDAFDIFELIKKFALVPEWRKISRDLEYFNAMSKENLFYLMPYYLELK